VETAVSWKRKSLWRLKNIGIRHNIPIVKSISTEFQTVNSFEYLRGKSTVLFSINVIAHVGNNSLGRRWMLQAGAVSLRLALLSPANTGGAGAAVTVWLLPVLIVPPRDGRRRRRWLP
jgi:hypothetical protein